MGHKHDWWEPIRRNLIPVLHAFLAPFGLYASLSTHEHEYVATVMSDEERFEECLHEAGFIRNPLAALKQLASRPTSVEEGSWVWRPDGFYSDYQLHVILFDVDGDLRVYAHWEYSWTTHPIKHYRGKPTNDDVDAVLLMRQKLASMLKSYKIDPLAPKKK